MTERIVVVGSSCAGKSTFARALAAGTGRPCVELDALHWGPNWTPRPSEEFRRAAAEAAAGDRWVIEGNYGVVREILWLRATAVVWLNYGFFTVLGRGLRRTVRRAWTGETLWNGNRETFRGSFLSRDSVLLWLVSTFRRRRTELAELRAAGTYPRLTWFEFRRPAAAESFLQAPPGEP